MTINIFQALKIMNTKKDFVVFTLDDNKVKGMILTNDLHRHYRAGKNNFRLTEVIKQEIKQITII